MVEDLNGSKVTFTWKSTLLILSVIAAVVGDTSTVISFSSKVQGYFFQAGVQSERQHHQIEDISKKLDDTIHQNAEMLRRIEALENFNANTIPRPETTAVDRRQVPRYVSCCTLDRPCKHGQVHCPPAEDNQ